MIYTTVTWPRERWPNFTFNEMACTHCGVCDVDELFMDTLQLIRNELSTAMQITSGYRCADHPIEVLKAKPGSHEKGCAVDVACWGARAYRLLQAACKDDRMAGIGIHQSPKAPNAKRFLHLDQLVADYRPALWSYDK